MIITPTYIPHVEPVMTYTNDAKVSIIEHYTSSQPPGMGTKWQEMDGRKPDGLIASQVYEPWTI